MFYKSNISFEKLQETFLSRELYCISLSSIFKKYLHVFLLCPLHFPLENMSLIVLLYLNMFWIHEWSVQFVRISYFFPVLHIQRYIYILWWFACVWVCNVLRTLLKQLFFILGREKQQQKNILAAARLPTSFSFLSSLTPSFLGVLY